jgi:hypothetical protein
MVLVSADGQTRQDLNIVTEDISDDQPRKVCEQVRDNPNYKAMPS